MCKIKYTPNYQQLRDDNFYWSSVYGKNYCDYIKSGHFNDMLYVGAKPIYYLYDSYKIVDHSFQNVLFRAFDNEIDLIQQINNATIKNNVVLYF